MKFLDITLTLNGVKLEYDRKTGCGWICGEKQKPMVEKAELEKQLEEERRKLSSLDVELHAAALIVSHSKERGSIKMNRWQNMMWS